MIRRTAIKRATKPIPKRRARPRRGPLRDKAYMHWISTLPCCVCFPAITAVLKAADPANTVIFQQPFRQSDPAHTERGGAGMKGPDSSCAPMCRQHHDIYDGHAKLPNGEVGREAFVKFYHVDPKDQAAECWTIWQERHG